MARFTFLEVHVDGAQFTANAPFSGEKSPEGIGKSIEDRIRTEPESSGPRSSSRASSVLLALVAVVGFVAVARRVLSDSGDTYDEATSEAPIVAD